MSLDVNFMKIISSRLLDYNTDNQPIISSYDKQCTYRKTNYQAL